MHTCTYYIYTNCLSSNTVFSLFSKGMKNVTSVIKSAGVIITSLLYSIQIKSNNNNNNNNISS